MNILLTGTTGFIGGHLLRQLVEEGHEVIAYGRKVDGRLDTVRVSHVSGGYSQTTYEIIRQQCGDRLPEILIHVAGQAHISQNERNKNLFEQNNVVLTANMLELATQLGIKKFIFFSTISVLSGDFQDIYAQTKLRAEEMVKSYCANNGMDYVIIRPVMVYGENDIKGNMAKLIRQLDRGFFPLFNHGRNIKEILYVKNLVAAVAEMIHRNEWHNQTVSLKDPDTMTMNDICHKIIEVLGHGCFLLPVPQYMVSASVAGVKMLQRLGFLSNLNANSIRRLGDDITYVGANDPMLERRMQFSSTQGLEHSVRWYLAKKIKK